MSNVKDSGLNKFLPTGSKPAADATAAGNVKSDKKAPAEVSTGGKKKYNINDFILMNTLGTGSFGRVHLVKAKDSKKFYAMKALSKNEIIKLRQVEHTVNEKNILEQLDNPFLVKMYATFQDSNCLFLVLEYIQGGELFSYLRKSGVCILFFYIILEISKSCGSFLCR
jgi:serine/threonine protein kinase